MSDRDGRIYGLFDSLATQIRAAELRSVGFAGAVFGDGASTLALGTSLSLAALGAGRVLLVDANSIRPSLTSDAGVASRPGLAEVLRGDADLGRVVVSTGRPHLAFLGAGAVHGERAPIGALTLFLEHAQSHFDTVVADLPPALASESVVMPWAASLQQLFVVVRSGVTPLAVVRRAVDEVALDRAQVILNRTSARSEMLSAQHRVAMT